MSIFRRGRTYWYEFRHAGVRYRRSTAVRNRDVARDIEAAFRTSLAKGDVGIETRAKVPTLAGFETRFLDEIRVRRAHKPETVSFYEYKYAGLLSYAPLASAALDRIDEGLIARFVQHKSHVVKPATVNRYLATLRRALRLAYSWKMIPRVPQIRLLPGEGHRDFVLTRQQEKKYLARCPEPLASIALLSLETGARIGELLTLRWDDVHLDPVGDATRGYIRIREGKSAKAQRNISLSDAARTLLKSTQVDKPQSPLVFAGVSKSTIGHQHIRARRELNLPEEFVIHSLRHTFLTRLGESGCDTYTLMRIAGHSTIGVSARYVHPSSESMERAFNRLDSPQYSPQRGADSP